MKAVTLSLGIIFAYFGSIWAGKILVLSPRGPKSHMHALMPLVEELASRGHHLTIVTPNPLKSAAGRNVTSIVVDELAAQVDSDWYDFKHHGFFDQALVMVQFFRSSLMESYTIFMKNPRIQELVRKTERYDIVIIDAIVNDFTFPLADHLGAPVILFDPGPGTSFVLRSVQTQLDYSYIPDVFADTGVPMTFLERLQHAVITEAMLFSYRHFVQGAVDRLARADFPNGRSVADIANGAELCFLNLHPASGWPRPLPPSTIAVPAMHLRPAQRLPKVSKILIAREVTIITVSVTMT